MTLKTKNAYGDITVTNQSVALVAGYTALECYGVVELVSKRFINSLEQVIKKKTTKKGVAITNNNGRIIIDLFVILKYGVSVSAVAESLKKSVKYSVEFFTGMIVESINVHIVGVKV